MNDNKINRLIIGILITAITITILASSSSNKANNAIQTQSSTAVSSNTGKDTDGDGIPDTVEKTYGTNPYVADTHGDGQNDKVDKYPLWTDNPINETSIAKVAD